MAQFEYDLLQKKLLLAISFKPKIKSCWHAQLRFQSWKKNKGWWWNLSCFLHFSEIQAPFLLLKQWTITQFFLVFSPSLCFVIITFFHGVIFYGMGTYLKISYKSKSLSTCENWCFNPPLSTPPSNSSPFDALEKAENAVHLIITLWGWQN